MTKLTIKTVSPSKLATEIRRRRAALIDMLAEEIDILGHDVAHKANRKMRQKRAPDDELVETIVIDGIPVAVCVYALSDDGTLRNKLALRFTYLRPGEKRMRYPSRASEPKGGWDITNLADRLIDAAERGKEQYVVHMREKVGRAVAKLISKQFADLDHRFHIQAHGWMSEDDFGPLSLNISGLCEHLVVQILALVAEAKQRGNCGVVAIKEHPSVPKEQLN